MTANGTSAMTERSAPSVGGRVDWVDYAKGICIVMVVMMHSVLGVEAAAQQTGFMHWLVMFAKPFRMPDFFLPMAATRTLLLHAGSIHDIGAISLIVTFAGVVGALALWRIALSVGANFLFERPPLFWIAPRKAGPVLQAAE